MIPITRNIHHTKYLYWSIGIVAFIALAGAMVGAMLYGPSSSPTAPGIVDNITPIQDNNTEPAFPPGASVATYSRVPQVRLNQAARADSAGSETLASVSNTVIAPQSSGVAPATVSIAPVEDWNPIFSQHTFTIAVSGADGAPADGVEVEVFLNRFPEAVGDIVALDGENPRKVDNYFGRVITNENGEAMLTITATREGDTDVTAFVPQIEDDSAHKVFAVKHWVDMQIEFPPDAVNLIGTDHPMLVRITKVSDGSPLSGMDVSWALVDTDPPATIDNASSAVSTTTDDAGETVVVLQQVTPALGDNQVLIQVMEEETGKTMFAHTFTKTWQSPTLEVDKQGPDDLGLRKTAEYTVSVTNTGDTAATNVTLTDQLPAGLAFVSSDPDAASVSGSTVTWSLGDLMPAETVNVTMKLSALAVGDQLNSATALSVEGISGEDTHLTKVVPGSLIMTKTAPEETVLGDGIAYEISITNDGEGALTNIVVVDTLPNGVAYLSSIPEATVGSGSVSWLVGDLEAGASTTLSVSGITEAVGEAVNTVTAQSAEGATASALATTLITKSDLAITKTPDNPTPVLGDPIVFNIAITNNGDATATNVAVNDLLPGVFQQVTSSPEAGIAGDGSLNWTIPSIEPGATENLAVTTTATMSGAHTNTVTARHRDETISADATVTVLLPEIALTKVGGTALYVDGQRTYTITATNSGTAPLHDVTITDTIPAAMEYVSSDYNGQESDGVVTWSVGTLEVGQSVAVETTLRGVSIGNVVNTANVTTAEGATAEASVEIQILAAAAAHINIIDSVDPMGVGETGSYTVSVTNQGQDQPMTNVNISITIPTQFQIVSAESGSISNNVVTYATIPALDPGQVQEFTVEVQAISEGDVVASATLQYQEFGQPITAQEGTTIVQK